MHGLAGSSHFLGVLVAAAFPTLSQSVAYLAAFAVGTIISMAAFSSVIGALTARYAGGSGSAKIYRGLMTACAVSAMAVGCFWLAH